MKAIALVLCLLSLSACATLQNVGAEICANQHTTRAALEVALFNAYEIANPERREAAILAINISLNALDQC